jgi:hypothetical protein
LLPPFVYFPQSLARVPARAARENSVRAEFIRDTLGDRGNLQPEGGSMSHVTYTIVQHDGGWAYKADGVFSEPFPTHARALAAARAAAQEQRVPGRTEAIEYEDEKGQWHSETAAGSDRPDTDVKDSR